MANWSKPKKLSLVELLEKPPAFTEKPPKARKGSARLAGLWYEKKVMRWLYTQLHKDQELVEWPWFKFINGEKVGWCSPDFVILPTPSTPLIIGEIKLQHKGIAEKKLKEFYGPIVAKYYGVAEDTIRYIQIAKTLNKRFNKTLVSSVDRLCELGLDYAVLHKSRFN